jgi:hypothetical protein
MQTRVTAKPEHEVIAAIQALDLESVKVRVMDPKLGEGWTREYAESVEMAYKNYLTMLVKYQDDAENILLAEDVDEFWHTHILQTMKYEDDCQNVFGKFLHHEPHVGEVTQAVLSEREEKAEKTRQLYRREFGGAHAADSAWSGNAIKAGSPAMSNVAIRAEVAPTSNIAIRADEAAMSNVAIRAANAAMSNVAIRAGNAAMSNVAIRADDAAMSNVAIHTTRVDVPTAGVVA